MGEKEKRTSKKNVDGRSTSSHDNKKLRTKSMEKQRGMAFDFRKKATAVKKSGWIDRQHFRFPPTSYHLILFPRSTATSVSYALHFGFSL